MSICADAILSAPHYLSEIPEADREGLTIRAGALAKDCPAIEQLVKLHELRSKARGGQQLDSAKERAQREFQRH